MINSPIASSLTHVHTPHALPRTASNDPPIENNTQTTTLGDDTITVEAISSDEVPRTSRRASIISIPLPPSGKIRAEDAPASESRVMRTFRGMWQATDLRAALTQGDNAKFLELLRNIPPAEADATPAPPTKALIVQLQEHTDELKTQVQALDLPKARKRSLLQAIGQLQRDVATLKDGVPWPKRLLRLAGTLPHVALHLAAPIKLGERSYVATLLAHTLKNAGQMVGLARNETTDSGVIERFVASRLFLNSLYGAIYVGPAFYERWAHVKESEVFHGLAAGAATTLFIAQFHPEEVRQASNWMRANLDWLSDRTIGVAREMIYGRGNADALPPMTSEVREQVLQTIARAGESLKADKETMQQVRKSFIKGGKELSDTLSAQITAMLDHIDAVSGELRKALPPPATAPATTATTATATVSGAQAAQQAALGQGSRLNMDFVYKLILTGLTLTFATSVVAQMWHEPMGRGDWIADGAAITWAMTAMHLVKQNSSRQDAQRDFTDLAGLTSVVTVFLALDKAFNYLHGDIGRYAIGVSAMAAANLTVPGAIANTAGSLLDAGLNALSRKKPDAAPNPADDVPATPGEAIEMDILNGERVDRDGGHDGDGMQAPTSDDIV